MNPSSSRTAIFLFLGLFGAAQIPYPPPADGRGSVLAVISESLRFFPREAIAQEDENQGGHGMSSMAGEDENQGGHGMSSMAGGDEHQGGHAEDDVASEEYLGDLVGQTATPSHVHQVALDLISEIEALREAMGVLDVPLEAEPHEDRAAIHAYVKSLEMKGKIAATQKRLGIPPVNVGHIPIKEFEMEDVYVGMRILLTEVHRIKGHLFIEETIRPAPFEHGKTLAEVYQLLGDASYLMDGLVGRPVDISDVYGSLLHVHRDVEIVAAQFGAAVVHTAPLVEEKKRLNEVATELLRSTYGIINLQSRLGMDASGVPQVELVRSTPAELNEAVNILQAEMIRIKAHLAIRQEHWEEHHGVLSNADARRVYASVLLFLENMKAVARAVAKAGRAS